MSASLFNRLSSGQDFLENAYSQENLEKQAKKLAQQQVAAVQGVAHQAITSAIGESGVEAAVGAAGIAYPFVKKYGSKFVDKSDLPDLTRGVSGVRDEISNQISKVTQRVKDTTARLSDSIPKGPVSAEELPPVLAEPIAPAGGSPVSAITQRAREAFTGLRQRLTQDPRFRPDLPPDIPTAKAPAVEAQPSNISQVSAPQSERLQRQALRRAERLKTQQEFDGGDPEFDAVIKGGGLKKVMRKAYDEPTVDKPTVSDPFSLEVRPPAQVEDFAQRMLKNPAQVATDRDPYQDAWDKAELQQQQLDMSQDRLKASKSIEQGTDYDPEPITEKAHLAKIRPEPEPAAAAERPAAAIPAEQVYGKAPLVAKPEAAEARINPAEQTGGISPADLPEGAGFSRGGLKIGAKKEVDPVSKYGEADTEDFLGQIEDSGRAFARKAYAQKTQDVIREADQPSSGFDLDAARQQAQQRITDFKVPPAPEPVAPVEPSVTKEPLPEVTPPKEPSLIEDVGKSIAKDAPEEEAALDMPAIGEVALAAVGVGQLISSLVERHKQNKEAQSAAAQAQNQPTPSVALDPSAAFDSTFR